MNLRPDKTADCFVCLEAVAEVLKLTVVFWRPNGGEDMLVLGQPGIEEVAAEGGVTPVVGAVLGGRMRYSDWVVADLVGGVIYT